MVKTFEISSKKYKNGKRHFKAILTEVYPESVIVNETGTKYNDNGCTFIDSICEKNAESINGMSLTCEFVNDERTEFGGHGETGEVKDGIPLFNNASMIGTFTKGYVETMEIDNETRKFLIGEGYIDGFRFNPMLERLDERLANGESVQGSVEIFRTDDNEQIVYQYGYKNTGRVPIDFVFSGFALIGVTPADKQAKLLELNQKTEETEMDEKTLALITDSVKQTIAEISSKNAEYEATIAELNAAIVEKDATIEELNSKVAELDGVKAECEKTVAEQNEKFAALEAEMTAVKTEKALAEMNEAIKNFSEEEKAYAAEEIKAFEEAPLTSEINSIITKIHAGIGAKFIADKAAQEKQIAEQNAKKSVETDIFSDVDDVAINKTVEQSIFD